MYHYLSFDLSDPAKIIEMRRNEQAGGRYEYYVHYEDCKCLKKKKNYIIAFFLSIKIVVFSA